VVANQVEEFGRRLPELLQMLEVQLETALAQPIVFNGEPILIDGAPFVPLDRIEEATGTRQLNELLRFNEINLQGAATALFNSARNLSGPAFSFFGGAFNTLINVTFLLMMTFYLLKDGNQFLQNVVKLVPPAFQEDGQLILKQLTNVWDAYVRGQLILCVVMGFTVYFAALVLGVPNAPMLGLLAGVLEFIPNLGPFIALIPAAFLALVSESSTITGLAGFPFMLAVIVVWTGLQNLESIFLVPRIMGDSLDLHPFVVIVGVLVGAALVGPLGVILAAPLVASIRVLLQYVYRKLAGLEPFAQETDEPDAKTNPLQGIITAIRSLLKGRPDAVSNQTKG
jgi:predicted PurR-regulated permease PerM